MFSSILKLSNPIINIKRLSSSIQKLHPFLKYTPPPPSRTFSSSPRDALTIYIEQWQKICIRPNAFYEHYAEKRTYFYAIDLHGRLFLEETDPKNIATSLKSDKFLDFFFHNLELNKTGFFDTKPPTSPPPSPSQSPTTTYTNEDEEENERTLYYPYFSACGNERNYIRPADVGVVFHDLQWIEPSSNDDEKEERIGIFTFGGTLTQRFNPENLAVSLRTGRLYHALIPCPADSPLPLAFKRRLSKLQKGSKSNVEECEYALIKSSVAVSISENIQVNDGGRLVYVLNPDSGDGREAFIKDLPERCDSDSWGLPPFGDEGIM